MASGIRCGWVGDSISSNLDFKHIEENINMDIKHTKAYTVTSEAVGAKFPEKNFIDVVEKELDRHDYSVLVLGGGTVEITNLNTDVTPEENLMQFKDEVIKASQKLFNLAECALHTYPSLDKVVLLRRPPRFDPVSVDPLELKPQLSRLGDSVLFDMWCNSSLKKKITLGDHQISHQMNEDHYKVFGHPSQEQYDGLHMNGHGGRHAFQESVLNILRNAGVCKARKEEPKIPDGRKSGSGRKAAKPAQSTAGNPDKDVPSGWNDGSSVKPKNNEENDAMGRMIKRIRTLSTKQSMKPRTNASHNEHDDVFIQPSGRPSVPIPRVSVIRNVVQPDIDLQHNYNIPVSNLFSQLLN